MKHLFGYNEQQIIAHSNPNLCVDCVARCSIKRFDVQMAFDKFEERLHIPSFAVQFSYCERRKAKVVGDKFVNIICRIILINNQPYPFWIICRSPWPTKYDVLVADETRNLVNRPFPYHRIFHVFLSPGDKECVLSVKQFIESLEINVSLVHQVIGKGFNGQAIHCLAVMHLTFCKMNKGGDASPKTEESVHFDSTFSMVEVGPWTKLEAKFYCTAVKGIDHFVNVETVILFVIKFPRLFDEVLREVMVNAPISFLIHFAKSGTWNERESGMVKLALKRCQSGLVSAQTLLRGQLCKAHDHKLVTAAELNLRQLYRI